MIHGSSRYSHIGVVVISITHEACLPVTDDYCGGALSGNISGYLIDKQYPRALRNRECRLVLVGNRGTIALKRLIKASVAIYHAALLIDRNEGLFRRDDFQPLSSTIKNRVIPLITWS